MSVWAKIKGIFSPIDMTKGSIVKSLLLFLIPTALSMLFQQLYTLTDAAIVGRALSGPQVAGVNNAGPLSFLVLEFGMGCAAGFSVIFGERVGAQDVEGARKSYLVQIVLSFFVSLIMAACIPLIPWALSLLHIAPSASDPEKNAIFIASKTYLIILFAGGIATVFYNMIVAVLRAKGDSFVPFLILVGATIVNIGLDALFVLAFGWGVAGSAAATIFSQSLAAIGAMIYAGVRYPELRIHKMDIEIPFSFYWRHIKNGLPLGLQFSILAIGMIVMQSSIVAFDITPSGDFLPNLAAEIGYGAACRVINIFICPLAALGTAVLAFVSQNRGAQDHTRIRDGLKKAMLVGAIIFGASNLIGFLLTIGGAYQYLFLSPDKISERSILLGNIYLYINLPGLAFLLLLFVVRNALQGFEKPLWPLISGIGELVARVGFAMLLPLLFTHGQAINSESGLWAFAAVMAADALAWLVSPLLSLPALWKEIKEEKPREN